MWTVFEHATKNLITTEPTATAQQCAHAFETQQIRHLPVLDEAGRPVGIVSDHRVLRLMRRDVWDVPVADILVEPPLVVGEEAQLFEVLGKMIDRKTDAALVVNGDGVLTGVFTEHDALELAANHLDRGTSVLDAVGDDRALFAVNLGTPAERARQTMIEHGVRHLLALDANEELAGVVSLRDLAGRELSIIDQRLSYPVITVEEDVDLRDAAVKMLEKRIGVLPVVGENGLRGILTRTDIARALLRKLLEMTR